MFLTCGRCSWCNKEINEYSLDGREQDNKNGEQLHFCNFICAKHYNDIIAKVILDIDKYNSFFSNNKLDNIATKIFIKITDTGFDFMPMIYNKTLPTSNRERVKMCKKYMQTIYEM